MDVVWFASYPPHRASRDERGDTVYLIKALKHLSDTNVEKAYRLNRRCRLDTKNVKQALEWFGTLGGLVLETNNIVPRVVLVPIPDSNCTLEHSWSPRTLRLADAIARRTTMPVRVSDALRWNSPQPPSHRGGSRDQERLLHSLVIVRRPPTGTIVLVDDVLTTGAHIMASAERMRSAGFRCDNAICVARTEARCGRTFAIRGATLLRAVMHP